MRKRYLFGIMLLCCFILIGCSKESNEFKLCKELREAISECKKDTITKDKWLSFSSKSNELLNKYCNNANSVCNVLKDVSMASEYDKAYNTFKIIKSEEEETLNETSNSLKGQLNALDMECQKVLE